MSMSGIPNHCRICNYQWMGSSPMDKCRQCHPSTMAFTDDTTIEELREGEEKMVREYLAHPSPGVMLVAAGLVVKGEKILLSQRNDQHSYMFHRWENSGGSIEEGETGRQAVVRELLEETTMHVDVLGLINVSMVFKPQGYQSLVIIHYLCTTEDEPQETDECVNPTWYDPSILTSGELTLMPGMEPVKQHLFLAAEQYIMETRGDSAGGDRGI